MDAYSLAVLEEFARREAQRGTPSLELLLCDEEYFGLTTASPLQRAICRLVAGEPLGELARHPHVLSAFGEAPAGGLPRPAEFLLLAGIRSAKSLFAAALSVYASQTCDLSKLGAGETPRVSVVSLKLDLAQVVYQHLVGNLLAKPALKKLLLAEPTSDAVILKHPSGRPVEVKVVAGSRAGSTLVARWSAGNIFDEAPRMVGNEEGVVNLDDMRAAVLGRLLPGAQILYIGSPWAPFGPAHEMCLAGWKKPNSRLVVVKAPAPWMNPVWWTEERCARLRAEDPDVAKTDLDAEFADPEQTLFPLALLDKSTRASPVVLEPEPGYVYEAAIDPATRGNAWTLIVATLRGGKKTVVLAKQWIGSRVQPLSPDVVLGEIATLLKPYHVGVLRTDQYAGDALRDIGARHGLYLVVEDWTAARKVDLFTRLRTEMGDGKIELAPDPQVRADLLAVRRKVTQTGVSIELPTTADGRHCDYAPAIALAISRWFEAHSEQPPPRGTPERADYDERLREEADDEEARQAANRPWWDKA